MELTKLQQKISKVCAPESFARSIRFLKYENGTATATDSFSLIEVTDKNGAPSDAVLLDKKTFEPVETHETYPEYEQLFEEPKDVITIKINARYLATIADLMAGVAKNKEVTLTIPVMANRPIVMKAKSDEHTARALIMPIMQ